MYLSWSNCDCDIWSSKTCSVASGEGFSSNAVGEEEGGPSEGVADCEGSVINR